MSRLVVRYNASNFSRETTVIMSWVYSEEKIDRFPRNVEKYLADFTGLHP
jgi:hypothetical protein